MDLQLSGKRALITGASRGIGAAIARRLALEGCDVILVARDQRKLAELAGELSDQTGRKIDARAADLSRTDDVMALAASCGPIDILVNNAGAIPAGRLDEIDEPTWRAAWDLKVFGYIAMTRLFYQAMREKNGGVILNIIGAAAQIRDPSYICGVTGNAALTAFTMSLGSDSHRDGIRVVGISPGPVATERLAALAQADSARQRPFGRAADPDEIAAAAALLVCPLSGYTSGTVLMVDGGLSARAAS